MPHEVQPCAHSQLGKAHQSINVTSVAMKFIEDSGTCDLTVPSSCLQALMVQGTPSLSRIRGLVVKP
jgi:hypothetical protein